MVLANLVTQAQGTANQCGLFDTGFAGTFYDPGSWVSVLDIPADGGANVSTPPQEWPVAYIRGDFTAMA